MAYYRFLYDAVGRDYYWHSRAKLSDAELAAVLQNPLNEVFVLHVEGSPAGFAELDRRNPTGIELVQFGLVGEFIGRGLGKWFLHWAIDRAWSYQPKRFWLHTCTLDHAAARRYRDECAQHESLVRRGSATLRFKIPIRGVEDLPESIQVGFAVRRTRYLISRSLSCDRLHRKQQQDGYCCRCRQSNHFFFAASPAACSFASMRRSPRREPSMLISPSRHPYSSI